MPTPKQRVSFLWDTFSHILGCAPRTRDYRSVSLHEPCYLWLHSCQIRQRFVHNLAKNFHEAFPDAVKDRTQPVSYVSAALFVGLIKDTFSPADFDLHIELCLWEQTLAFTIRVDDAFNLYFDYNKSCFISWKEMIKRAPRHTINDEPTYVAASAMPSSHLVSSCPPRGEKGTRTDDALV